MFKSKSLNTTLPIKITTTSSLGQYGKQASKKKEMRGRSYLAWACYFILFLFYFILRRANLFIWDERAAGRSCRRAVHWCTFEEAGEKVATLVEELHLLNPHLFINLLKD